MWLCHNMKLSGTWGGVPGRWVTGNGVWKGSEHSAEDPAGGAGESASSCISYVKTAITRSESICKCHSRRRRKPVCSYLTEILSVLKFVPDSELENHLILDLRDLSNPNVCKWEYWRPWKVWWRVILHSTCRRPRSKDKFSSVALLILVDIS